MRRDNGVENFEFDSPEKDLVLFREVTSLLDQPFHAYIAREIRGVDPRQFLPDLQVAQIVDRKVLRRRAARPVGTLTQKLRVASVWLDHPLVLRRKEVLDDERLVFRGQRLGRLQAKLQIPVVGLIGRECLQLHEERRHQVERGANLRELLQQRHHAVVVLQGMQANPRQDVLARDEVLVIGLVHVPEERNGGHGASLSLVSSKCFGFSTDTSFAKSRCHFSSASRSSRSSSRFRRSSPRPNSSSRKASNGRSSSASWACCSRKPCA